MKLDLSTKSRIRDRVLEYIKIYPEYVKLSEELKHLLESLLSKKGIEFINIIQRAKDINSFQSKLHRKKYGNPFIEMKDLCAVRIICGFLSDVRKIERVLKKNFKITMNKDKEEKTSPYKFWYRSHDFEIELSKNQISKENYPSLKQYFAEVQIRTVFMDAWATMEHKVNYKHEWNTSDETKRKFSRLSALLELADEQLEDLANKK